MNRTRRLTGPPKPARCWRSSQSYGEAGLDQGQTEQGAAITAAFTLTQDVMSEQQEDTFLSTLGADFQAKITEFATSTYKLFKEVYNDALAHKNMAGRLESAYKFFEKIFFEQGTGREGGQRYR